MIDQINRKEKQKLEEAILRIQRMERYLEEILELRNHCGEETAEFKEKMKLLEEYYTGGQWLEDYERDERKELPPDLKRGVLAEDTLYDLLVEFKIYS